eukprot:1121945-Prymnesium_polylepis.1
MAWRAPATARRAPATARREQPQPRRLANLLQQAACACACVYSGGQPRRPACRPQSRHRARSCRRPPV